MNKNRNRLDAQNPNYSRAFSQQRHHSNDYNHNSFLTSTMDVENEYQKQRVFSESVDDYLTEHFKFVNKNRNRQLKQLSVIRQNLNRKFKELQANRKHPQQQMIRQSKFDVVNPSFKSAGNTQSFERQIENCNRILNDLRVKEREIVERKRKLETSSRAIHHMHTDTEEGRFPLLKRHKQYDYLSSPQDNKRSKVNRQQQTSWAEDVRQLQRSIDRASLRNYRNRNYYDQIEDWNRESFQASPKQDKRARHQHIKTRTSALSNRHPKFMDYLERDGEILDQLYNISQVKTELSQTEENEESSPSFSPKQANSRNLNNIEAVLGAQERDKQRRLKQLNSAKLKSLNFYQKVRDSKRRCK